MDEVNFEDKLNELISEFGKTPALQYRKLSELAKQAQENHKKIKKSFDSLQESLDVLRVYTKYQTFDLEATRRIHAFLVKLFDENS